MSNSILTGLDGEGFEYRQKEKAVLHIAVRIADASGKEVPLGTIALELNDPTSLTSIPQVIADVSADAIKERVRLRITQHPSERWLICSGNTIGETASPPVRFRSV